MKYIFLVALFSFALCNMNLFAERIDTDTYSYAFSRYVKNKKWDDARRDCGELFRLFYPDSKEEMEFVSRSLNMTFHTGLYFDTIIKEWRWADVISEPNPSNTSEHDEIPSLHANSHYLPQIYDYGTKDTIHRRTRVALKYGPFVFLESIEDYSLPYVCKAIMCHGTTHHDKEACYGHGTCMKRDVCTCESGWSGEYCEQINLV